VHEVSIMQEIFEIVNENILIHNIEKVTSVTLQIGEFSCVEAHALEFAFEAMSKDTPSENAELRIERVKAKALCSQCDELFEVSFTNKICPECGTFSNDIKEGYELVFHGMEGE